MSRRGWRLSSGAGLGNEYFDSAIFAAAGWRGVVGKRLMGTATIDRDAGGRDIACGQIVTHDRGAA